MPDSEGGCPGLIIGPRAAERLDRALAWLTEHPPATELLIVAPTLSSARELAVRGASRVSATFGWHRTTLDLLASDLATAGLASRNLTPVGRLGIEAITARVVSDLRQRSQLGRYSAVADTRGFVRALSSTIAELRLSGFSPGDVRDLNPDLARVFAEFGERLQTEGLVDRAGVYREAVQALSAASAVAPRVGLPTLLLDVTIRFAIEARFVAKLVEQSPESLITVVEGDSETESWLEAERTEDVAPEAPLRDGSNLRSLQSHLFTSNSPGQENEPEGAGHDRSVLLFSAPGQNRECVEVVRQILSEASEGVAFDRMAVLLHSPLQYLPHLEEAFTRAEVPCYFDRGVIRPDPAGRALLALLRCREASYSANRFAEYLSLGQVPANTVAQRPSAEDGPRWVPPDNEGREPLSSPDRELSSEDAADSASDGGPDPDVETGTGTLRTPRRWEKLIVEASVVGGIDRWRRRLDGLEAELQLQLEALDLEDASEALSYRITKDLADLQHLRKFVLPILETLAELPEEANWDQWIEQLSALASKCLKSPDRVLALLNGLAPIGPVGPVDLTEVIRVLSEELLQLSIPPERSRDGRVFIGSTEAARGRVFDIVFVPGLAERLFPRKIIEDPILLDADRSRLVGDPDEPGTADAPQPRLETSEAEVARERLALRTAIGAAASRVVLSYPRMDMVNSRPRVPSFYALECLRSAEGRLPLFEELAERADAVTEARVGWPAPTNADDAIDAAEYDLAVLEELRRADPAPGAARYLLSANAHLARALRHRAYRWRVPKWHAADGLVSPPDAALAEMKRYRLASDGRPTSASALQSYAACPYRYFLSTVHRLEARRDARRIETLDPLQKGALVHEVQFAFLSRLRDEGRFPLDASEHDANAETLDEVLLDTAGAYKEKLVPAIDRVWEDTIEGIQTDLRRWLKCLADDDSGYEPWRFELSFGVPSRAPRDPHSRSEPVELEPGVLLRGAIDLVERRAASGDLRITDHKTGKSRVSDGAVVDGGKHLQPVLYALAAEVLFPDTTVNSGRLWYCTSAGGFASHEVRLDRRARDSGRRVLQLVAVSVEAAFLPAAPAEGECKWCDYRSVCGPWEERRTAIKPGVPGLTELRDLR